MINKLQLCNSVTTDGFKQTIVMPDSPICLNTARVCGSARTAALWKWWRKASVIHSDPRYLNCCLVKVCCWCLDDIGGEQGRCDAFSVSSLCIKKEEQQVNCCFRVSRARHRLLFCDMKSSTLRMPLRRFLRDVRARNGSWARPSKGRTASNHQHHEGPLGLACKQKTHKWDGFKGQNEVEEKFGYFSPTI